MAKMKSKKPLKKYQGGGDSDNPFSFPTSGLANPFASGINYQLGTLNITDPNQQYLNLGDNPFGQRVGEGAMKTAGMFSGMMPTSDLPEWGGEYSQKLKQEIAKEKGLKYNEWSGKWKNDKGEVYTNDELMDLAGQRYDAEKAKRERNRQIMPLAAPMLMLNELGEQQKTSYNLAQKEGFYDVTKSPLGMESKGFFARDGMRTPSVLEVYKMMGADTGVPTSTTKITSILYPKKKEEGGLASVLDNLLYDENNSSLSAESFEQGGETNSINYKDINNMYNNNQRISRLAMMLGGGLVRNYQDGGMQQPMSQEEAMMMEQAMMEQQAMDQQAMQQQQQPMPQQGQQQQQPQQGGENKYLQLPPKQQLEVYKQIIDFVAESGIDALEQEYPEEYEFFEQYSDQLEGEEDEAEVQGEEMEMRGGEEEMPSEEEIMMMEQQAEQEYPTDEQEVPLGARPGENSAREPMQPQQMKQGGIPERYRNMGFSKVGQKKKSTRPEKRWMVLAKKGDQYKVVHGGDPKMEDFTQHGSKKRQEAFWDRMGGRDSAKTRDVFSPLHWHKKFGTW